MADPNDLVEVTLTIQRMYRAQHADTTAIIVGPGLVTVPRWVAAAWGIQVPEPEPDVVVDDLDDGQPTADDGLPEPDTTTADAPKPKRKTKKAT